MENAENLQADNAQSGFVISGYDEAFACPNYHSHRDTRASVGPCLNARQRVLNLAVAEEILELLLVLFFAPLMETGCGSMSKPIVRSIAFPFPFCCDTAQRFSFLDSPRWRTFVPSPPG